jgi:hypothetical protein
MAGLEQSKFDAISSLDAVEAVGGGILIRRDDSQIRIE